MCAGTEWPLGPASRLPEAGDHGKHRAAWPDATSGASQQRVAGRLGILGCPGAPWPHPLDVGSSPAPQGDDTHAGPPHLKAVPYDHSSESLQRDDLGRAPRMCQLGLWVPPGVPPAWLHGAVVRASTPPMGAPTETWVHGAAGTIVFSLVSSDRSRLGTH